MIENRDEKIEMMDTYKEKDYKEGKCFWKYFLNGFLSPFNPSKQKYCLHCCKAISDEEYMAFGAVAFGCESCREEK